MSDQIENHFILEFQGEVEHLLQQGMSRFRGKVSEGAYKGRRAEVCRQFGAVAAVKKTARNADLPTVEVPHSRRWVVPQRYEFAEYEDNADTLRAALTSSNEYAKSFAMSLARAMDDEVIEAATGTAVTGETGTGSETFDITSTLYTGQTTGYQIASGSTQMTVDKLRKAKRIFRFKENDLDRDKLYCAISAEEEMALLEETQLISFDYNRPDTGKPVLTDGKLTSFMGIEFVHSERLLDDGTDRSCFMWVESGLHLGIWDGVRTPIDWIPKMQSWQTAGVGDFGATRTQLGKVVEILCTLGA